MSRILSLALLLATLVSTGCAGTRIGKAPMRPDGARIAMLVQIDDGLTPEDPPARVTQVKQLSTYMEENLLNTLKRTGYDAVRADGPGTAAGPGRHVLRVKIVRYEAGSKAARILVGMGAGSASLETHFELIGEGGTALVSGDPRGSAGWSGGEWTEVARSANEQTVKAINDGLRGS